MPAVAGRCKRYFAYLCRVSRGDARDGLWLSIKPEAVKEIAGGGIGACRHTHKMLRYSRLECSLAQTPDEYQIQLETPQPSGTDWMNIPWPSLCLSDASTLPYSRVVTCILVCEKYSVLVLARRVCTNDIIPGRSRVNEIRDILPAQ